MTSWGVTKIERGMSESLVLAIYAARVEMATDEEAFLTPTIELAQWYDWRTIHIRPARTKDGYRTAVSGDGKGFPDLFGLRRATKHRFAAELKFAKNKPTPEQAEWLLDMEICGIPTFTWYPRDIEEIKDVLKRGAEWPAGFRRKPAEVPALLF
jgi:hypothetical protein